MVLWCLWVPLFVTYAWLCWHGVSMCVALLVHSAVRRNVCLCSLQSGYFSSMFSGNWKESTEPFVSIDIPDPNITVEGKPSFVTTLSYCGEYNPRNKTGKAWGFASKAGQCLMLSLFQEDNILIWHTYIMHFTTNLCHKYLSFMSCACIHAALDLAFSSLYRDEVHLVESEICSIIAAASMLQLVSGHTSTLTCGYRTIFAITL